MKEPTDSNGTEQKALSTKARKKLMIEALKKTLGVVTPAAKEVGINRETHYSWLLKDKKYKSAVESIKDISLDFAESKLHTMIKNGNVIGTIFFLKTQGKGRGYIERTETEISGAKITVKIKPSGS
jgi:hypothetical protein